MEERGRGDLVARVVAAFAEEVASRQVPGQGAGRAEAWNAGGLGPLSSLFGGP